MTARGVGRTRGRWSVTLSLCVVVSGCYTLGTVRTLRRCAATTPSAVYSGVGTPAPAVAWTLDCASVGPGLDYAPERSGTLQLAAPSGCAAPVLYTLGTHADRPISSGEMLAVDVDGPFALELVDPVTAATAALTLPAVPCALLVAAQQGSGAPEIVALAPDGRAAARQRVHAPPAAWLALPTAALIDVVFVTPVMIIGGLISLPYWLITGHLIDDEPTGEPKSK